MNSIRFWVGLTLCLTVNLYARELSFPTHDLMLTLPDSIKWRTTRETDVASEHISIRTYEGEPSRRYVTLMFGNNNTPAKDLEGFAQAWARGFRQSGATIVSEHKGSVSGLPAFVFEVQAGDGEALRSGTAVVTLCGEKAYTFLLTSHNLQRAEDDVLSAITASIRIGARIQ